jgi:hypothetical protein
MKCCLSFSFAGYGHCWGLTHAFETKMIPGSEEIIESSRKLLGLIRL